MSASPPREADSETQGPGDHPDSGDAGHAGALDMGGFYDMDVKEQDRWLPIANGMFIPFCRREVLKSGGLPLHCPKRRTPFMLDQKRILLAPSRAVLPACTVVQPPIIVCYQTSGRA